MKTEWTADTNQSRARQIKNIRNNVINYLYQGLAKDRAARFSAEITMLKPKNVIITIAYNTPWCIDVLAKQWSYFCEDAILIVFDNSNNSKKANEIKQICRNRSILYCKLPQNPEWSPNLSHGIALNWAWNNVIKKCYLQNAGIIDHDCFPVREFWS